MELQQNINLENILIKETCIFNGIDQKFDLFFKRHNIKTLKDLFDLSDEEISQTKLSIQTKNELRGMIELLKYKYLNIPLIADEYLNQPFSFESPNDNQQLIRMGFTTTERRLVYGPLRNENVKKNQLTYLDVLKRVNTKSPYLNEKIRLYMESYSQKEEQGFWESKKLIESLKELTTELQFLQEKRNSLNLQIDEIQNQISELQNKISQKGNIR